MLNNLRFADDIVLISQNREELNGMTEELSREAEKVGLEVNATKTKIISNKKIINLLMGEKTIECANNYKYLGQTIALEKRMEGELKIRIAKA